MHRPSKAEDLLVLFVRLRSHLRHEAWFQSHQKLIRDCHGKNATLHDYRISDNTDLSISSDHSHHNHMTEGPFLSAAWLNRCVVQLKQIATQIADASGGRMLIFSSAGSGYLVKPCSRGSEKPCVN